ncbi:MAG: acetyl-CoA carboxylase biotin carboxylase subunit [Candidatus Polarisedimenticolia bacterium]
MNPRPIRRLLIANRGEIAVRIARACEELGITSIAAASEADGEARHARAADEKVILGGAAPRDSYLRADLLLKAAKERGCDAVHPGYGFLAENPVFAEQVADAGLTFVGPPAHAIRLLGDKIAARATLSGAGVPVLPGFAGSGREDAAALSREAARVGYPLLVKSAGGGGGRGMRMVREPGALAEAVLEARREAASAFADERLFLERYFEEARHVEFQILADGTGSCVHLFERDCSIQRRFQKIVEESPSPFLDPGLRARMGQAAIAAARASGYVNAGTVEFLVLPDRSFFFLEVNARLQVEHPVTEAVTGVDLVRAQIRIAAGEPLPFRQADLGMRGHALECRIMAEDPAEGFRPAAGRILLAAFPDGPGVRVDAGVESGDEVPLHYDPLLAKIVVHDEDRAAAIARMERALSRTAVLGVPTLLPYLRAVLAHPVFRAGAATTAFTTRELGDWRPAAPESGEDALLAAAVAEFLAAEAASPDAGAAPGPWDRLDGFRPGAV